MQRGVERRMHSTHPVLVVPAERQHWIATYNNVRLTFISESLQSPPEQHSQRLAKVLYTSRSTSSNRSERLSASTFRPLHTSGELHLTSIRCLWRRTYCCASATCLGRVHTLQSGDDSSTTSQHAQAVQCFHAMVAGRPFLGVFYRLERYHAS